MYPVYDHGESVTAKNVLYTLEAGWPFETVTREALKLGQYNVKSQD